MPRGLTGFSVSYSSEKDGIKRWYRSAAKEKSPYMDWIHKGSPLYAVFQYTKSTREIDIRYVFIPSKELLHIECAFKCFYFTMQAQLNVSVDRYKKQIHAKSVKCERYDCYLSSEGFRTGGAYLFRDGLDKFRHRQVRIYVLEKIASEFFGVGWKFKPLLMLRDSKTIHMGEWMAMLDSNSGSYPLDKTIAYFNLEPDVAATIIQAAFRGWRVRMQYRYSPYNNLGRYVILREADFATKTKLI